MMPLRIIFYNDRPPFEASAGGIASYIQHRAFVLGSFGADIWWTDGFRVADFEAGSRSWGKPLNLPTSPLVRKLSGRFPGIAPAWSYLIKNVQPQLIEFPDGITAKLPFSLFHSAGIKVAIQCHTAPGLRYFLNVQRVLSSAIRHRLRARHVAYNLTHADGVLACSSNIQFLTSGMYRVHPDKFMVIPHAFSRNAQPGLKEQNVNIADTPYYLVASNMEYFKGLDLILHAFIRYKRQGGKAALVFAGTRGWSDPYPTARYVLSRPDVQKLIPEAKSAGVSFAGSINKEELSQLRRGALATVVGSRFEAFTMVAGEAFLSGCPVILSSRTGWRDLAERYAAALIVDPIDIVSFAGAMLQMERPEVRERICTGGERLAEYLTSSELWEKTAAWYQRVAGRGV